MEEKYIQKMYEEIFYRTAAVSSAELDMAAVKRDVASPRYTSYSQQRYEDGLAVLKKRYAEFVKAQREAQAEAEKQASEAAKRAEAAKQALAALEAEAASAAESVSAAPATKPVAACASALPDAACANAAPGVPMRAPVSKLHKLQKPLRYLIAGTLASMMLVTGAMAAGGVFDKSRIIDHGEYGVVAIDSGVLQSQPDGWTNSCYPTWIPHGFELVKTTEDESRFFLSYKNSKNDCLNFDIIPFEYNTTPTILSTINTENSDAISVHIHGNPCTVYVRRDFYYALCYFSYEGVGYLISGNVSADDIVHMAEKLSIFSH